MKKFYSTLLLACICVAAFAQKTYFVDGYHGGIYGHYPVAWKTRFITDQLAAHPEWRICLEIEPETWDSVRLQTPEAYQVFKKKAADHRIEFTNPAYAQPYCYNISGESIIRNFEYGIKTIHRHFPDVTFVTYSVEEPCFTSALPQILNSFGFQQAVLKCPNTCWGGYMREHGGEMVNWIGPDGSAIRTVPRYECEQLQTNSTWQTTAWGNSDEYLEACRTAGIQHPVGMCFQDAGWKNGPWIGWGDHVKNSSTYVTWREYFETISTGKPTENYRLSQDDVLPNLMWGSQVLQKLAQEVRVSENRVVMAEKLGTMAHIANGYRYDSADMDEAWRTLMLSQHHDSWIVPYNQLNKSRSWAEEITVWTDKSNCLANSVIDSAIRSLESGNASHASGTIRVYNTTGHRRQELTKQLLPAQFSKTDNLQLYDAQGRQTASRIEIRGDSMLLAFVAEVPAVGYATYRIERAAQASEDASCVTILANGDCLIENDQYRIVVDASRGGILKSLIAKKEGRKEFVDPKQPYLFGELRGYFYDEGCYHSSCETPAQITILQDNDLECSIRIAGEIASHPFVQILSLSKGQPRIDFDLTVAWKENVGIGEYKQSGDDWTKNRRAFCDDRYKLNVLFPVNLDGPQLSKDAPFDVCQSQQQDTHFKTWDAIKHNIILHWVDLAERDKGHGLALFTDHTTSYSYGADFPLALTAQYSGVGLWGRDYSITGPLKMHYAVVPHRQNWAEAAIPSHNENWNEPLLCSYQQGLALENRSFMDLGGSGYELSAAQITDRGLVVRLFNAAGSSAERTVRLSFPVTSLFEVDLAGNIVEQKKVKQTNHRQEMRVAMPRFGFRTYLINSTQTH